MMRTAVLESTRQPSWPGLSFGTSQGTSGGGPPVPHRPEPTPTEDEVSTNETIPGTSQGTTTSKPPAGETIAGTGQGTTTGGPPAS
jgi:hypothetical protein